MVLKKELRGSLNWLQTFPISCRLLILHETPESRQRLVDRRMVRLGSPIAVPSSIGPLPLDQRLGKLHNPRVLRETQPATHCQRVTLLRRTSPISSIDLGNIAEMSLTKQPFQDKIRRLDRGPESRGHSELDERDQAPVCACPFLIGMNPETTIIPLPGEKGFHNWSVRNLFLRRQNFFRGRRSIKNLCESEIAERGII